MSAAQVRNAGEQDIRASVELISAHRGGDLDEWRTLFADALHDPQRHFIVAVSAQRVVGFGLSKLIDAVPDDADPLAAPVGWHLSGVTVDPGHRHRGIGAALTQARLDRLRAVTDIVYYAAESSNAATVELHRPFGFRQVGWAVKVPGADRPLNLYCLRFSDGAGSGA